MPAEKENLESGERENEFSSKMILIKCPRPERIYKPLIRKPWRSE